MKRGRYEKGVETLSIIERRRICGKKSGVCCGQESGVRGQ
jgi:hypothetical protein